MSRGADELILFEDAMAHELADNEHKGHWLRRVAVDARGRVEDVGPKPVEELHWELLYHATKLVVAVERGDKAAVKEYAADTANCAMFVADHCGALAEPNHTGPVEYDEAHADLWKGLDRHQLMPQCMTFLQSIKRWMVDSAV